MSQSNEEKATPVHLAAESGRIGELDLLLTRNPADLEARDDNNATPLHYAAAAGQVASVRLLLEKGASPFAKDNDGFTPRNAARAGGAQGIRVQEILKGEERRQAARKRSSHHL